MTCTSTEKSPDRGQGRAPSEAPPEKVEICRKIADTFSDAGKHREAKGAEECRKALVRATRTQDGPTHEAAAYGRAWECHGYVVPEGERCPEAGCGFRSPGTSPDTDKAMAAVRKPSRPQAEEIEALYEKARALLDDAFYQGLNYAESPQRRSIDDIANQLAKAEVEELKYLRNFWSRSQDIVDSPIEGDTIEQSARALWAWVLDEGRKTSSWADRIVSLAPRLDYPRPDAVEIAAMRKVITAARAFNSTIMTECREYNSEIYNDEHEALLKAFAVLDPLETGRASDSVTTPKVKL